MVQHETTWKEKNRYETFEKTTQHLPYPVDTNRDFYAREWGQYIIGYWPTT